MAFVRPSPSCDLAAVLDSTDSSVYEVTTKADGPEGSLPLTDEMLREWPSGDLFGLTQNAGMGWDAERRSDRDPFLILSTQGGLRAPDGTPIALGYHTGHWEIGLLVQDAAEELRGARRGPVRGDGLGPVRRPDAGHARDDGQPPLSQRRGHRVPAPDPVAPAPQGRPRRRDLRQGPARDDAGAGGFAAPARRARPGRRHACPRARAKTRARSSRSGPAIAHGELTLAEAAELGCRACASPGGGCQFLGTAATSQVVAEALGLTLPHAALAPSGQPIWHDMARRSARALVALSPGRTHARRYPHRGRRSATRWSSTPRSAARRT